jgi:hypothetical protein
MSNSEAAVSFEDLHSDPVARKDRPENADHKCEKCKGTGSFAFGYRSRQTGKCFACNGRGFFRTSQEQRARARMQRVAKKQNERVERFEAFKEQSPDVAEWIEPGDRPMSSFRLSLYESACKYGSLTEKQLAAARRIIASDKEKAKPPKPAGTLDVSDLRKRFDLAKASGIARPRINLGDLVFSMAGERSKNPGCIYVKAGTGWDAEYYGKVDLEGNFYPARDLCDEDRQRVLAVTADVFAAARAHGARHNRCCFCSRDLTTTESVALGWGPVCAERYGLPHDIEAARELRPELFEAREALKRANDGAN